MIRRRLFILCLFLFVFMFILTSCTDNSDASLSDLHVKYAEYINNSISILKNSLKNPKSLDIYDIYINDQLDNPIYPSLTVYIDASGENSFGGTVRDRFYIEFSNQGSRFYKCETDVQNTLFKYVVEISTGQRSDSEATKLADGYYHRVFIAATSGEEVDDGYYLHVPSSWYDNQY